MDRGARLAHYRIAEPLGSGGMGEVYRALDTRLGRDVAIKVLPAELRSDPGRLARLEREARLLAALNHPHVATLHGLEEAGDGTRFLVMELVEGETLQARLARGALPLAQVFAWGAQIAEALAAAHERDIVHRDLKPANVMLVKSGVKLIDFGLAKAEGAAEERPDSPPLETATLVGPAEPLTRQGSLVGTLRYMAPEQVEGREADERSDVWAFGALLYEMATGEPAFAGRSAASLIAAILEQEPARVSSRHKGVPGALDHLVASCLIKDPDLRRRSAADAVLDLRWLGAGGAAGSAAPALESVRREGRRRERLLWFAVALLAAAGLWSWTSHLRPPPAPARATTVRFELPVPWLGGTADEIGLALSPDGRTLAYSAPGTADGAPQIWLRRIDEVDPRALPGSVAAMNLFWSPAGRHLGYVQDGAIKIADLEGGPTRTLYRGRTFGPPSWGSGGTILFSAQIEDASWALFRIPAKGGEALQVRRAQPTEDLIGYVFPHFLPDGQRFVYMALQRLPEVPNRLFVDALDNGEPRPVDGVHSRAEFVSGRLYFCERGTLLSSRFDADRAMLVGESTTLGKLTDNNSARTGAANFAVAPGGVLAYGIGAWSVDLRWFDRNGAEAGRLGQPAPYERFRISPSGDRVAVSLKNQDIGDSDLWVVDIEREVSTRLAGGRPDDGSPVWSSDGTRIAYSSDLAGVPAIYVREADGSGEPSWIGPEGEYAAYPWDWSRDGTLVAYGTTQRSDVVRLLALDGRGSSRPYLKAPGGQYHARFSPDGKWVAFMSAELLDRAEVFVAPLDDGNVRHRVSADGGWNPVWGPGGRELFFLSENAVHAATFSPDTGVVGRSRVLFPLGSGVRGSSMDVTPDGKRFLVAVRGESWTKITVVLGADGAPEG